VGNLIMRFLVLEFCSSRAQLDLLLSRQISQLELAPVSTSRSAPVDFSGRLCLC
jgi:hypothetical protein